jgi:hypothetical protein
MEARSTGRGGGALWSGENFGLCVCIENPLRPTLIKATIFVGDVAHCERSLQTFNIISGDQLYRY